MTFKDTTKMTRTELSIYEVNEMLVANGYLPFGSSPAE